MERVTNLDEPPFYIVKSNPENDFTELCIEIGSNEADAQLIAAAPVLLKAIKGLLEQVNGPVGVWGDGRGIDGKKTGLSSQEFDALRKSRIAAAQVAIAKAENK